MGNSKSKPSSVQSSNTRELTPTHVQPSPTPSHPQTLVNHHHQQIHEWKQSRNEIHKPGQAHLTHHVLQLHQHETPPKPAHPLRSNGHIRGGSHQGKYHSPEKDEGDENSDLSSCVGLSPRTPYSPGKRAGRKARKRREGRTSKQHHDVTVPPPFAALNHAATAAVPVAAGAHLKHVPQTRVCAPIVHPTGPPPAGMSVRRGSEPVAPAGLEKQPSVMAIAMQAGRKEIAPAVDPTASMKTKNSVPQMRIVQVGSRRNSDDSSAGTVQSGRESTTRKISVTDSLASVATSSVASSTTNSNASSQANSKENSPNRLLATQLQQASAQSNGRARGVAQSMSPCTVRSASLPPLVSPRKAAAQASTMVAPPIPPRPALGIVRASSALLLGAAPLQSFHPHHGAPVFMDSFCWTDKQDPFYPTATNSLEFDPQRFAPQRRSLLLAMDLPSLLNPSRPQLELLWSYCENLGGAREVGGLGKLKLIFLASEIHAKLFMTVIQELKQQEGVKKWNKIQSVLMRERVYLIGETKPSKSKNKKSSAAAANAEEKDYPKHTQQQLANLKATAGLLLKTMDLNGDLKVSRQEFLSQWPTAAQLAFASKSRPDGKKANDGVINCVIM